MFMAPGRQHREGHSIDQDDDHMPTSPIRGNHGGMATGHCTGSIRGKHSEYRPTSPIRGKHGGAGRGRDTGPIRGKHSGKTQKST